MTEFDQDFDVVVNTHHGAIITIKDPNGDPLNVTDAVVEWALGSDERGTVIYIQKSSEVAGEIDFTDATNGVVTVNLEPADTEGLDGEYFHEARVTLADLAETSFVSTKGKVTIHPTMIPHPTPP